MPKGKPDSDAASPLPILIDPELCSALSHTLRQHIMVAAGHRAVSPKDLAEALGQKMGTVAYQTKVLRDSGVLEVTHMAMRRGAVQRFYRTSGKTLLPAKLWRQLKGGIRAVVGAGMASDLFNDVAEALNAGKLQGSSDYIVRIPLVLDAKGQRKVNAITKRATREVEQEHRATAKRLMKGGDSGEVVGCTYASLFFEATWNPADVGAVAGQDPTRRGGERQ